MAAIGLQYMQRLPATKLTTSIRAGSCASLERTRGLTSTRRAGHRVTLTIGLMLALLRRGGSSTNQRLDPEGV
jgi:hypothetical protein